MSHQIGVAILGWCSSGDNYARVFSELPQSRVVAICDRRTERLQQAAHRFPGVHLTTQTDAAIRMDGVDAVVVCTDAPTRHAIVSRCLRAGRDVLVETPLTTRSEDAEDLIERAEALSRVLMVGDTVAYNSGVRQVKEFMKQGADKRHHLYSCRFHPGPHRHDVSPLWDLAPHDIGAFNYLLDRVPQWVSAVGARMLRDGPEDVGFISLGYPDHVIGHIHVSWADSLRVRQVVVITGSDRRIVFNDVNGAEQVRRIQKEVGLDDPELLFSEYQFQIYNGDVLSLRVAAGEPLENQCRHFLQCIAGHQRPLLGGTHGLEVVRVLDAVAHSLVRKGAPVEVARSAYRRPKSA